MKSRNWDSLARKLVDRTDMDFTIEGMSEALDNYAAAFFGEGVAITALFPNPFVISMSSSLLGGSVGNGLCFDALGQYITINPPKTTNSPNFTVTPNSLSGARFDLLVLRYAQVGDTLVPKPSDPISTVNLNLHDDFILAVIPGIVGAYPSKLVNDVIIAGIQVPVGATVGSSCVVDLSIREMAIRDTAKFPVFKQEELIGTVDGVNTVFNLSATPINNQSVLVFLDGLGFSVTSEYSIIGEQVTFVVPPAIGQLPYAWYVEMSDTSVNPLSGFSETPIGVVDGINGTFVLSGKPANKDAVMVFVDGDVEDTANWNLIQNAVQTSIQFLSGHIPAKAQKIFAFYLINSMPLSGATASAITEIENVGSGLGIFQGLLGSVAKLKTIKPGVGITIVDEGDDLKVSAPASAGGLIPQALQTVDISVGVIPANVQRQIIPCQSSGGSQIVTANPQIEIGTEDGQELILVGNSDIDFLVLNHGNGLSLNGTCNLTTNQSLFLYWNGTVWNEISRRN